MTWTEQDYQVALKRRGTETDPQKKSALEAAIARHDSQKSAPDDSFLDWDPGKAPTTTGDLVSSVKKITGAPEQSDAYTDAQAEERRGFYKTGQDSSLKNASKLKAFDAPPTYFAGDGVSAAVSAANTRFYEEPPVEQFRAELARDRGTNKWPLTGDPSVLDENSLEYQAYADKLWKDIYEQAKHEGKSVVRISQAPDALKYLGSAGNAVASGGLAALDIMTLGATDSSYAQSLLEGTGLDRENQDRVRGAHPLANAAGEVAGTLAPTGAVSLGTKAASGAAKNVVGGSGRTATRVLREGAVGAGVAGAESMVRDVVKGDEVDYDRAAIVAALGLPAAAAGEFLGSASGKSADRTLRSPGVRETVIPFEESGGSFGPLLGAKNSLRAERTISQAIDNGVDPVAQGVSGVRRGIAAGALETQDRELAQLGPRLTAYYDLTKNAKQPMHELGDALYGELKRRSRAGGGDEAFVQRTNEIRKDIKALFIAHPAQDSAHAVQLLKSRPGSLRVSYAEMENLGLGDMIPSRKARQGALQGPPQPKPEQFAATRVTNAGPVDPAIGKLRESGALNTEYLRSGMRKESAAATDGLFAGADPVRAEQIATQEVDPIVLQAFPDGRVHVVDGRHRMLSADKAGAKNIRAKIQRMDQEGNVVELGEHVVPLRGEVSPEVTGTAAASPRGQAAGAPMSQQQRSIGEALPDRQLPPYPSAREPEFSTGGGEYVILEARPKNPQEADVIIDAIDARAKADGVGKPADPMYAHFMAKARAVRDRYPANAAAPADRKFVLDDGKEVSGFSALKAQHDNILSGTRSANERAGLPGQIPGSSARAPGAERVPDLSEQEWVRFESVLTNHARTGGTPESSAALNKFAAQKGLTDELRNLRQLGLERAAGDVAGGTDVRATSGGNLATSGALRAVERRSLPLRAALAGDGASLKEVASSLSPGLRSTLRRLTGQGATPPEDLARLAGASAYQSPPTGMAGLGLRGGRTGPLAAVGEDGQDAEPELTPDEVENLMILIQATRK